MESFGNHVNSLQKQHDISWNHYNPDDILNNHKKSCDNIRNDMQSIKTLQHHIKSLEIMWNHEPSYENTRNQETSFEILKTIHTKSLQMHWIQHKILNRKSVEINWHPRDPKTNHMKSYKLIRNHMNALQKSLNTSRQIIKSTHTKSWQI